MKAKITVTLKPGVLDPQGKAIASALLGLGFPGVGAVRAGKIFEVALAAGDEAAARAEAESMCARLLANPVMEDYAVEIVG